MTIEVKLPDLGDGIESGDVLEIFVSVGDTIEKGQDIVEMETDKATVTVPASIGGTVTKVLINEETRLLSTVLSSNWKIQEQRQKSLHQGLLKLPKRCPKLHRNRLPSRLQARQ